METTRRRRQGPPPVIRTVTALAADDDLVVDMLHDTFAGIEPEDISDLLDLATLVHEVEDGTWTIQTAVVTK
ncbi:hypothetical protein ACFVHA_28795 [Bacillus cereus]|uniref:hypothetical protein n=1 Tax=Bacillus cereus TaxID=1396 RepID=UPI0036319B1C